MTKEQLLRQPHSCLLPVRIERNTRFNCFYLNARDYLQIFRELFPLLLFDNLQMTKEKLLRQAHSYLLSKRSSVIWPRSHLAFHSPTTVSCPTLSVLQRVDRRWFALRLPDAAMSSRPLVPWVRGGTAGATTFKPLVFARFFQFSVG